MDSAVIDKCQMCVGGSYFMLSSEGNGNCYEIRDLSTPAKLYITSEKYI